MSTMLNVVTDTLGARLSFGRRLRKRVPTRIPENVNGGDDDGLRRLMQASTSAMPFEARCDTHLCLSEGSLYRISDGPRGVNPWSETVSCCTLCAKGAAKWNEKKGSDT